MKNLPQRIRAARRLTKLSQERFADEIGVSRSAVANWETGHNSPDVENLITIAQRSGMMFEHLATGRGPEVFGAPTRGTEEKGRYVTNAVIVEAVDLLEKMSPKRRRAHVQLMKV